MHAIRRTVLATLATLAFAMQAAPAEAISISPGSAGVFGLALGPSNCEPECVYSSFGIADDGSLSLLYKADSAAEGGTPSDESGLFEGSYDSVFMRSRQDSTIGYTGGASISCGTCYLVIKDGNHNPSYYFFDLAAAGWDGIEDIIMTGFWPGPGSISHVAIWGSTNERSVPEPGSLALLGLGLAGLAASRRRRRT